MDIRTTQPLALLCKVIISRCKNETGIRTTLNDFFTPVEVDLDLAPQIIAGLSDCESIAKADLKMGFRHVLVDEDSWANLTLKLKFLCPELGGVIERWLQDPTAVQGLRPSPCFFNKLVRFFILLLITYFPRLYTKRGHASFERELKNRWGEDWDPEKVAKQLALEMDPFP